MMYPTLIRQNFPFAVHLSRLLPSAFGRWCCCVCRTPTGSRAVSPLLNPRVLHRRVIVPDRTYGSQATSNVEHVPVQSPFCFGPRALHLVGCRAWAGIGECRHMCGMNVPLLDSWHGHAREDAKAKCREALHNVKSAVLVWYDSSQLGR
jgi:hypothetical protein